MSGDARATPPAERILALDALRGFAVFGILLGNMPQYFLPEMFSGHPVSLRGGEGADTATWLLLRTLVDGKFLTLFSLLFGISFALLYERLAARPRRGRILARRIGALFAIGAIHGLLFYYADILMGYALAAVLLWPLMRLRPRTQLVAGLLLLATIAGPWRYLVSAPGPDAASLPALLSVARAELAAELDADADRAQDTPPAFSDAAIENGWAEIQAYRLGPAARSVAERSEHLGYIALVIVAYVLWRTLALFLIGSALYRSGIVTRLDAAAWRRYTLWLLPTGVALNLLVGSLLLADYREPGGYTQLLAVAEEAATLTLAAGYAALVFWLCRSSILERALTRIASVGRTALTNYILQSVVMSVLATHYGLALFGEPSRTTLLMVATAFFLVQMEGSHRWTRRFRFGPLEWGWRCVSYWHAVPLRGLATTR